ncbi:hypothetical protein Tco_0143518 [Tanacetum coccineum]
MAGILDTPQSLMPSLEGVNAEKVINKSSSGTAMQDLSHPKAKTKTDRMKKNKQNPTPSQPKPFKNVKITRSKKTVAKSYTAEDLEATADELQILDTSRSVDQQHPTLDNQTLRVLELHSAFRVTKSQNKKNLKVLTFEEADKSSLVSLGHFSMYLKESQKLIHVEHIIDVQELAAKLSDMEGKTCVKKQATNQYLSLVKKIGFHGIAANIHNTGNKMDFLPEQLNSTLDDILPRFIVDSQEERLRKMLFDGFLYLLADIFAKTLSCQEGSELSVCLQSYNSPLILFAQLATLSSVHRTTMLFTCIS